MELYSRVVRIGGPELGPNCGYRDIVVHEMTEGEIRNLKEGRWLLLFVGLCVGFIAGGLFTIATGPYPKF